MKIVNKLLRILVNKKLQKRLKNKNFSLLSSNCTGAFLLHDLGLKFNSPFVNLWMKPKDFIEYLSNIEEYNNKELKFIDEKEVDYPVAKIGNISIYFQHYQSELEARKKWNDRVKRIDYNNLYIIMTDRDGITQEDYCNFDKLPFENKILFTNKKNLPFKSVFYIKGFEDNSEVGNMFDFTGFLSSKKYYDQFDYISWFNKGIAENDGK